MKLLFRTHRLRQGVLAIWVLSLVLAVPQVFTRQALAQQHPALVDGVDAIGITVSDMDRAVDFYSKVLTFEKVSDTEVAGENYEHLEGVFGLRMRVVRMRLGDEFIELTEYLAPKGRPIPVDSRSNDLWFQHIAIIVSDMDKAYAWLRQNKVEHASSGPQRLPDWNKNAAGISAFYFKDPDEHPVEVLQFPPDKGLEKWHRPLPSDKLFLGIDHTAIVVWDTDASVKFYRDLLGLHVASCEGALPEQAPNLPGAAAACIVYADRDVGSVPVMDWPAWAADRQSAASSVRTGDPFCTVFGRAPTAAEARQLVKQRAAAILAMLDARLK